jgi:hypothetical protein
MSLFHRTITWLNLPFLLLSSFATTTIVVNPLITSPTNAQTAWRPFTSTAGKFAATFPTAPESSTGQAPNGTPLATVKSESNLGVYVINYTDDRRLASLNRAARVQILQQVPSIFANSTGSQITAKKPISLGQNPGIEFTFSITNTQSNRRVTGKGRAYSIGARMYVIAAVGTPANMSKFLSSFRLI